MFILSLAVLVAALAVLAFGVVLAETTLVYIALVLGGIGAVLLVAEAVRSREHLGLGPVSEAAADGPERSRVRTDGLGKASVPAQTPGASAGIPGSAAAQESTATEGTEPREPGSIPAQSAAAPRTRQPAGPHPRTLPGRPDEGAAAQGAADDAVASVVPDTPAGGEPPQEWAARDFDDTVPAPAPAPGGSGPVPPAEEPAAAAEAEETAEAETAEPARAAETEPPDETPPARSAPGADQDVPVDETGRDRSFSAFVTGLNRDAGREDAGTDTDGAAEEPAGAEPDGPEAPSETEPVGEWNTAPAPPAAEESPPTEPIDLRAATAAEPEETPGTGQDAGDPDESAAESADRPDDADPTTTQTGAQATADGADPGNDR